MEKFNELITDYLRPDDAANPSWDDTPEEPIALAYSPDPIGERVFITEAYAHDVVKLAEGVMQLLEKCSCHVDRSFSVADIHFGRMEMRHFKIEFSATPEYLGEMIRICNVVLARGEQ